MINCVGVHIICNILLLNTTAALFFYFCFYLLILERERDRREKDRQISICFSNLFIHSLVDSRMCPDGGSNLQPWHIRATLTSWAAQPRRLLPSLTIPFTTQDFSILSVTTRGLCTCTSPLWERTVRSPRIPATPTGTIGTASVSAVVPCSRSPVPFQVSPTSSLPSG